MDSGWSSERAIWVNELKACIVHWYPFNPPLSVDPREKERRGLKNDSCRELLAPWNFDINDDTYVRLASAGGCVLRRRCPWLASWTTCWRTATASPYTKASSAAFGGRATSASTILTLASSRVLSSSW
jgi:hypothetical protein